MTDKELTPDQDQAVRRLLGEARHDEPMPEAVAARLDDVLAGLVTERASAPADETAAVEPPARIVVPFRERRWPKALVAAAAVCAMGLGLSQVDLGAGAGDDSDAGDASRATVESEQDAGARDGLLDGSTDPDEPVDAPAAPGPTGDAARGENRTKADWKLNRFTTVDGITVTALSELSAQLQRSARGPLQPLDRQSLARSLHELAAAGTIGEDTGGNLDDLGFAVESNRRRAAYDAPIAPRACGPLYTVVGGTATYARYRSRLALVLFHPKINGAQLVEIYVCANKAPRRSVERVTLWDGE